jgi:hypothetical protein
MLFMLVLALISLDTKLFAIALLLNAVHIGAAPTPPLVNADPVATFANVDNVEVVLA